jgi:hypothetical protein
MTLSETAREHLAQQRQRHHHVDESMLERSSEEVGTNQSEPIQEEVRESLTAQRQKQEHTEDSLHRRIAEEVKQQNSGGM